MMYLLLILITIAIVFPSSMGLETVDSLRGAGSELDETTDGFRQLSSKGKVSIESLLY